MNFTNLLCGETPLMCYAEIVRACAELAGFCASGHFGSHDFLRKLFIDAACRHAAPNGIGVTAYSDTEYTTALTRVLRSIFSNTDLTSFPDYLKTAECKREFKSTVLAAKTNLTALQWALGAQENYVVFGPGRFDVGNAFCVQASGDELVL